MSTSTHLGLCKLFNDLLMFEESGFPPISILYRIFNEGHVGRTGRPGHKILCREMSPDQRRLWTAFRNLGLEYQIVVIVKHMPVPMKKDGEPKYKLWDDKQKAAYLNEFISTFRNKYKKALKRIEKSY